jgi:hypothetical protein
MYGANTIAGMGEFTLTGYKAEFAEDAGFEDTVKRWVRVGADDAGEISFSGNYDPDDTNGQIAINAIKATTIGMTNLYFYDQYGAGAGADTYSFFRVASGGDIKIGDFNNLRMAKNGIGTVTFSGRVSGAGMERVV